MGLFFINLKIEVDESKCNGCGDCRDICPKGDIIWKINGTASASRLRYCHVCTICAMKCSRDAIKIIRDAPYE